MDTPPRGSVVLCNFPYAERPTQRGPQLHLCLVAARLDTTHGRSVYVVSYGTSRLDESMLSTHSAGGGVLSVPVQNLKLSKGELPKGSVGHFLARHVAVIPSTWVYPRFGARFDFMRPESRLHDLTRQKLYDQFEVFEETMTRAAHEALDYFSTSGRIGLKPSKRLRNDL